MTWNWFRRETSAMASDRADTTSDAMLIANERRSDASAARACSRNDASCSRIRSHCDSMVRMSCAKSGSFPSDTGRSASTSGHGRSRRFPRESTAILAFSVATLVVVAFGAITGHVFALIYGATLSVFWIVLSTIFLLLGRSRKN